MGHFQSGKHGPGPFNLGPWVISKAENMDLGYLIWAHGPFPKWKTWTWDIILSPWVIYIVMNLDLRHFQSGKHGPGPLNICPWDTSTVMNLDLGHYCIFHVTCHLT